MVFYRKYRPQKIAELDLLSVRNKLTTILQGQEVPHAFLFTGTKGLGKTSTARILARAINCENNLRLKTKNERPKKNSSVKTSVLGVENIEPCNECDTCLSIINGSNIDIIEIDAASNRGIEEIRSLREKIKFSPAVLSKKVYIIDEVHMLTPEAFNALLKTLEEPPTHALFILCTTELHKLPETIISRAFVINFEKPSFEEIQSSLGKIVEKEKISFDESVYKAIFHACEGSFRDAHKIIEELTIAAKGNKITKELFESLYKTESIKLEVEQLIAALSAKNVSEGLFIVDKLTKSGADMKVVVETMIDTLRTYLLSSIEQKKATSTIETYSNLIELFQEAHKSLKYAVLSQLPIELAIVKWSITPQESVERQKSVVTRSIIEKINSDQKQQHQQAVLPKDRSVQTKIQDEYTSEKDFLRDLIEEVKQDNHSIAGLLRGSKISAIGEDEVVLSAPYKFHGDKLKESKTHHILELRASELLGKRVKVQISVSDSAGKSKS